MTGGYANSAKHNNLISHTQKVIMITEKNRSTVEVSATPWYLKKSEKVRTPAALATQKTALHLSQCAVSFFAYLAKTKTMISISFYLMF